MKKIFILPVFIATLGLTLTSCLKDKGFENGEYGINDPDTQPPGVGFPLAASAKYTVGLDVSATPQVINDVVFVNLNSGSPAPSDITITLTLNDALRTKYNTDNNTNILALNPALFSVGTTVVIPAGERFAQIPITVSNTTGLDPNSSYGVGISITAVTGNLVIAGNLDDLFLEFQIKNKYDGKYTLRGYHTRPGLSAPYEELVHMVTSGPNSAYMYWPALGAPAHPLNGGTTYYGSFTTNFIFDLTTNVMTGWDMTPYPTSLICTMVPVPGGNRWEPATRNIYATYQYSNNPDRRFIDTLEYEGPR